MKNSRDWVRLVVEVILLSVFLGLVFNEWNNSTDDIQRIIVGFTIALALGLTNCCVIFRLCLDPSNNRFDFHISVLFSTILLINQSNNEFNLEGLYAEIFSLPQLQKIISLAFLSLLFLNLFHYMVVGLAMITLGAISLVKIWISSDSVVNVEGLTQLEFASLSNKIISEEKQPQQNNGVGQDCAICLSEFLPGENQITITSCSHQFHTECISVWFKSSVLCPYCRSDVRKALQKIKFENHILLHKGTSYLDTIIEQAEPSYQLEEFINDNNLRQVDPFSQLNGILPFLLINDAPQNRNNIQIQLNHFQADNFEGFQPGNENPVFHHNQQQNIFQPHPRQFPNIPLNEQR